MLQQEFWFIKKLINILIKKGKKAKAFNFFLSLLKRLKKSNVSSSSPIEIIHQSLLNIKPVLTIQKVRKSSKIFYLPRIIKTEKKIKLGLFWIIKSVNSRKEKELEERLTNEILDCFSNKGSSIQKKLDLYETMISNRPFLHLVNKYNTKKKNF